MTTDAHGFRWVTLIAGVWFATPAAGADAPAEPGALSRRIDAAVSARLASAQVAPAARADDVRLMRRMYLDVIGRPSTAAKAAAFLADPAPDRVGRLADRLLADPEMPVYWRRVLDGWFSGEALGERRAGHDEWLDWLERSLAADKPWDRMARELLVPDPADPDQAGASYFLASRLAGEKSSRLDTIATDVASALFGVQLQCAKCHDHPFVAEWRQDHFYGLAAFFARTESKNDKGRFVLQTRPAGEVTFTARKRERTAAAMFLDGVVLDAPAAATGKGRPAPAAGAPDRRRLLADHALRPESPYLKRSLVNRVWKQLMGRGLVEPVDQIHAANPASHPELLDALADDFAAGGFRLRRLMAGILHSDAYRRDSRRPGSPRPPDELYAAAIIKPLSGVQMAWSLTVASGATDQLAARFAKDKNAPSAPAPVPGAVTPALRRRWERDREFQQIAAKFPPSGETFQANAGQALFLTFNPLTRKLVQPAPGNLAQRVADAADAAQAARLAFLAVLSRPPEPDELAEAAGFLAASADRRRAAGDLVWALLTSAEFRFSH